MNRLYCGDNLEVLREHVRDASVDLVYLDPPFNSRRSYKVLYRGAVGDGDGTAPVSQITAFDDTWHWGSDAEETLGAIESTCDAHLVEMIRAIVSFAGRNDLTAYLVMMTLRLVELRRVLKPTGSIYLHCDPTSSHYLKVVMDTLFGKEQFVNEVVWQRTNAHNDARRKYPSVSDSLLVYGRTQDYVFHTQYAPYSQENIEQNYRFVGPDGRRFRVRDLRSPNPRPNLTYDYKGYKPHRNGWSISREKMEAYDAQGLLHFPKTKSGRIRLRRFLDEMPGVPVSNVWTDIKRLHGQANERLGYPTQKPLALLDRIMRASSSEGDLVLDPFCGCGTTIEAAQELGRQWIGIDISHLSMAFVRHRLDSTAGEPVAYEVTGQPADLPSAQALARESRFQFKWWALSLIGARPVNLGRLVADRGLDGMLYLEGHAPGQAVKTVVQVKRGQPHAAHIRALSDTIQSQGAVMGYLISLERPAREALSAANAAGRYQPRDGAPGCARAQILTVEQLLAGERFDRP